MHCPHCQTENEQNAPFCRNCSAWILGDVYIEDPLPVSVEESAPEAVPSKKKKQWLVSIVVCCAVVAVCILIALLPRDTKVPPVPVTRDNGYIYANGYISFNYSGNTVRIIDDWQQAAVIPGPCNNEISMDGTAAAFLDADNVLFFLHNGTIQSIAENVTIFSLSADGSTIAYAAEDGLFLYQIETQENTQVSNSGRIGTLALSPDGNTVLYFAYTSADPQQYSGTLICWQNGQNAKIRNFEHAPRILGVPNDGAFFYIRCMDLRDRISRVYSVTIDGKLTLLKENKEDLFSSVLYVNLDSYINADHTQFLYHKDGKTYLSDRGQNGICIADQIIRPLVPDGCGDDFDGRCFYYPHYDFSSALYVRVTSSTVTPDLSLTKTTYDLYRLVEGGKAECLLENASQCQLSRDGNVVYCVTEGKQLRRMHFHEDGTVTDTILANHATTFALGAKFLYYTTGTELYGAFLLDDETEFMHLANGKSFSNLLVNQADFLFCIHDATGYTLTEAGQHFVRILNPGAIVTATANHLIFVRNGTDLSVSADGYSLIPLV